MAVGGRKASSSGGASQISWRRPTAMKWDKVLGSERGKDAPKGVKPLPEPMTVQQMGVVLVMHVCRRILLVDTEFKIGAYGIMLLFGSVLCDFFPLPRTYLANKNSVFNQYFAKLSWGWTLLVVGTFVYLTSRVYCCDHRGKIKRHLSRLVVGTAIWYCCIAIFGMIEEATGFCYASEAEHMKQAASTVDRDMCLKKGYRWRGFDISGHSFLLIYCSLVIHEEAKAMKGWERIRDLLREVDFDDESPLKSLSREDLSVLRSSYEYLGLYIKLAFGALTFFCVLWDLMLVGTILYYHTMAQKVAGGLIAIFTWFLTYRVWYTLPEMSPGLPGQGGPFKYAETKVWSQSTATENRRRSIVGLTRPPLARTCVPSARNGHPSASEIDNKMTSTS